MMRNPIATLCSHACTAEMRIAMWQREKNEKRKIETQGVRVVAVAITDATRLPLSEKGVMITISQCSKLIDFLRQYHNRKNMLTQILLFSMKDKFFNLCLTQVNLKISMFQNFERNSQSNCTQFLKTTKRVLQYETKRMTKQRKRLLNLWMKH